MNHMKSKCYVNLEFRPIYKVYRNCVIYEDNQNILDLLELKELAIGISYVNCDGFEMFNVLKGELKNQNVPEWFNLKKINSDYTWVFRCRTPIKNLIIENNYKVDNEQIVNNILEKYPKYIVANEQCFYKVKKDNNEFFENILKQLTRKRSNN